MIYFIQDTQTQAIRIGYSNNPLARLANLQAATPGPLILLGAIPGSAADEAAVHARFAAYRLHGEWYQGNVLPAVQEIIANNLPAA